MALLSRKFVVQLGGIVVCTVENFVRPHHERLVFLEQHKLFFKLPRLKTQSENDTQVFIIVLIF